MKSFGIKMTKMSLSLNKQPVYYATLSNSSSALSQYHHYCYFWPRHKSRDFRNYKNSIKLKWTPIRVIN